MASKQDKIIKRIVDKFTVWKNDLHQYHEQIDRNQQLYEFLKEEASLTSSDVSTNTTFAIIEGMISKCNESELLVDVMAVNQEEIYPFNKIVANTIKHAICDPDVEAICGTFRERKEMYLRDFFVKGNAVGEFRYLYKETIENGQKVVAADNPVFIPLELKSVVFDTAFALADSPEYIVEKFTDYETLESQKKKQDGSGIYENLEELKTYRDQANKDSNESDFNYSSDKKIPKKNKPIRILEYWNGAKLTVIADDKFIIRQVYDPFKIGRNNLVISMNYRVTGRPYAYGELDAVYKTVRAQDTILNQSIETVNQFLKPSVIIQPGAKINLQSLIAVIQEGGVAYGDPKAIGSVPRITPPQQAFLSIDTLQQVIERTTRFSPYTSGIPNSTTDKTQGTMGGILAMQEAAEPNFQVKMDKIRDSLMRPLARIFFKMIVAFMGDDEIKYSLISGAAPSVIRATKGILSGNATLMDLIRAGFIDQETAAEIAQEVGDPNQAIAYDVDWMIDVKLDNRSKRDKSIDMDKKIQAIKFVFGLGGQFSPERVAEALEDELDLPNFTKLLLSEQEKMQIMAKAAIQSGMGTPEGGSPAEGGQPPMDMAGSPNPEAQAATQIPPGITPETTIA